jgi:acetolactate synthase small subunit
MSQQKPQKPKQPRKSKRLKLLITKRDKWKQILAQIETLEAPISVIEKIEVELIDGTLVDINVQELLAEGYDEDELEEIINGRLDANDDIIKDASFFIDADHVASTVQPITDSILKNL